MGNTQQYKYITKEEAFAVLGKDNWQKIRIKLEKNNVKNLDFNTFNNIITSRFERIPGGLTDCLYRAFTNNSESHIDVETFLLGFAVIYGNVKPHLPRFLFRVYEENGVLERKHMETILTLVYTEPNDYQQIKLLLDQLFMKRKENITLKEFELYTGNYELLIDWIRNVLNIFLEKLPIKLFSLHKKYSAQIEAQEMIQRFHSNQDVYQMLRQQYSKHCNISLKPELQLSSWLTWTSKDYLSPIIAEILFLSKTERFKHYWRFMDFAEFALINGTGNTTTIIDWLVENIERFAYKLVADIHLLTELQASNPSGALDDQIIKMNSLRLNIFPLMQYQYQAQDLNNILSEENIGNRSKNPDFDPLLTNIFMNIIYLLAQSLESTVSEANKPPTPLISTTSTKSAYQTSQQIPYNPQFLNVSEEDWLRSQAEDESNVKEDEQFCETRESSLPNEDSQLKGSITQSPLFQLLYYQPDKMKKLPQKIQQAIEGILENPEQSIVSYKQLLLNIFDLLPGLRDLGLTACTLFGIQPNNPTIEKEYITELTLRYVNRFKCTGQAPYGPENTSWSIVSKLWIDSWRLYVGRHPHLHNESTNVQTQQPSSTILLNIPPSTGKFSPSNQSLTRLSHIDNRSILKRTLSLALLPNLLLGKDIEVVPPTVFQAFSLWYTGGPLIHRKVAKISLDSEDNFDQERLSSSVLYDVEVYPLNVNIVTCDSKGRQCGLAREMLFSRSLTIRDMVQEIAIDRKLPIERIRLWNYGKENWKDQYIISPEISIQEANLIEGQNILLETSLLDGSWPRSQLHSLLSEEEKGESATTNLPVQPSEHENKAIVESSNATPIKRNSGLVGLDNLGNTCYLNSSLQSLLHSDLLMEYFLSQAYLKDINPSNKHGFGGKLATIFGKLAIELWTTKQKCITPRLFFQELAKLKDQFAGNEQHDSHELLAFLLDGLSEDLNLVHSKPYTLQPDSDGRSDEELANIWWENHLKRDRSVIQALFTGQFKSIMSCKCGYSSARFEPFNFLSVPIPEDDHRIITLHVVPRNLSQTSRVAVRVPKTSVLRDVVDELNRMELEGLELHRPGEEAVFLIGDLLNSRIKSFIKLDRAVETIREADNLVFFQVLTLPVNLRSVQNIVQESSSSSSSPSPTADLTPAEETAKEIFQEYFTLPTYLPKLSTVRVAFVQRNARFVEGQYLGLAGFDYFKLETFGVPILEVLPSRVKCRELYAFIENRLKKYLKAPINELIDNPMMQKLSSATLRDMISPIDGPNKGISTQRQNIESNDNEESNNQLAPSDRFDEIQSISTAEIVGGAIPRRGFTLRLIHGGTNTKGISCSSCNWTKRCQGCVLPDSMDCEIDLQDGQSLSIDWHYLVFEELMDIVLATNVVRHKSILDEKNHALETKIPLAKCLEKFNEQETLEGIVCPKCLDDTNMKRSFTLWRLPPLLIIQIKRFQFDRFSRKKLNQCIDFPLNDLNVQAYVASTRKVFDPNQLEEDLLAHHQTTLSEPQLLDPESIRISLDSEIQDVVNPETVKGLVQYVENNQEMVFTHYDLYSVVHHIGALDGGHYVSTVRRPKEPSSHSNNTSNITDNDAWYLFNDNLVMEINQLSEIQSPSAYVLFYRRKDIDHEDIQQLLAHQLSNLTLDSTSNSDQSTSNHPSTFNNTTNPSNSSSAPQSQPHDSNKEEVTRQNKRITMLNKILKWKKVINNSNNNSNNTLNNPTKSNKQHDNNTNNTNTTKETIKTKPSSS